MITERDRLVLNWVGEMYAIRIDLLCYLLGRRPGKKTIEQGKVSLKTTERRVKVWADKDGLVERKKIFYSEPAWIWLSKKGLSLLEYDYRFLKPKLVRLKHIHAVNQVRLFLEQQNQDLVWHSERRLKFEFARDDRTKKRKVPDAEIVTDNTRTAIEIELTPKTAQRTKEVLLKLATSPRYDKIWYFAEPSSYKVLAGQIPNLSKKNQTKFELYHLAENVSQFS